MIGPPVLRIARLLEHALPPSRAEQRTSACDLGLRRPLRRAPAGAGGRGASRLADALALARRHPIEVVHRWLVP